MRPLELALRAVAVWACVMTPQSAHAQGTAVAVTDNELMGEARALQIPVEEWPPIQTDVNGFLFHHPELYRALDNESQLRRSLVIAGEHGQLSYSRHGAYKSAAPYWRGEKAMPASVSELGPRLAQAVASGDGSVSLAQVKAVVATIDQEQLHATVEGGEVLFWAMQLDVDEGARVSWANACADRCVRRDYAALSLVIGGQLKGVGLTKRCAQAFELSPNKETTARILEYCADHRPTAVERGRLFAMDSTGSPVVSSAFFDVSNDLNGTMNGFYGADLVELPESFDAQAVRDGLALSQRRGLDSTWSGGRLIYHAASLALLQGDVARAAQLFERCEQHCWNHQLLVSSAHLFDEIKGLSSDKAQQMMLARWAIRADWRRDGIDELETGTEFTGEQLQDYVDFLATLAGTVGLADASLVQLGWLVFIHGEHDGAYSILRHIQQVTRFTDTRAAAYVAELKLRVHVNDPDLRAHCDRSYEAFYATGKMVRIDAELEYRSPPKGIDDIGEVCESAISGWKGQP